MSRPTDDVGGPSAPIELGVLCANCRTVCQPKLTLRVTLCATEFAHQHDIGIPRPPFPGAAVCSAECLRSLLTGVAERFEAAERRNGGGT